MYHQFVLLIQPAFQVLVQIILHVINEELALYFAFENAEIDIEQQCLLVYVSYEQRNPFY